MLNTVARSRVLIVDDERVIAETLVTIFHHSGYEARCVFSAEEALTVIPEWRPSLAIVDVLLPEMNGVDLAIRIRAEYPGTRIALFSGYTTTSELLEAARQQGHEFNILAKPVHPADLLDLASTLLATPAADRINSDGN